MTELDPLTMTIELLGGLALFLYGMEKMTDGLKAAAGKQMNTLLAKLTGHPVLGAITGGIVTAVCDDLRVEAGRRPPLWQPVDGAWSDLLWHGGHGLGHVAVAHA